MRTTITIDDKLYAQAMGLLPSPMKPSELVGQALLAWIRAESAKHLIAMGGQAPNMADIPRRREPLPG
nr:type II toxin-antitoxin system VapB family antitoxin [uncultured Albidiferax sp.]